MKAGILSQFMNGIRRHENGILTLATGVSTLYAVWRAIKDGPKILNKIEELNQRDDLTGVQKVKELGSVAGPVVMATGASLAFTALHHKYTGQVTGALSNALTIAQLTTDERRAHENAEFGEGASDKIDESVAMSHANAMPVSNDRLIINTGHGTDLFFDDWSGRWFYSDINEIKARINELNYQLMHELYISVNEYYDSLDLPRAGCGEEFGWNVDYGTIDPQYFAKLDDNDKSYTVIKFRNEPCARWDSRRRW